MSFQLEQSTNHIFGAVRDSDLLVRNQFPSHEQQNFHPDKGQPQEVYELQDMNVNSSSKLKLDLEESNSDLKPNPPTLVVDDDSTNIFVIQSLLKSKGHDSDTALLGSLALDLVKERIELFPTVPFYKLVLMDFSMPEMDGPQVVVQMLQLIKDSQKDIEVPHICCCTAYEHESFKLAAKEAGMHDYICKPVTSADLDSLIQHL